MPTLTNPQLKTIKSDYMGNPLKDGRFLNYQRVRAPKFKDILNWRFSRKEQAEAKKQDQFKLITVSSQDLLSREINKIVWLGHASFLITLNGKNILLDPVFGNIPMVRRRAKIPFSLEECTNIDYILISHSHYDHLDKRTLTLLAKLNPKLRIYCGLHTSELLRKWKINNEIIEAGWYQQFPVFDDGIEFYFMPALHWSKRTLYDRNWLLWGSFIIQNMDNTIYFMGDSGYSPHFKEIGTFFPKLDYALLGIGAYLPRNIMQSSHVNPDEAYQAYLDLGAKYLVPMHYATYDLTDEPYGEPLQKIRNLFTPDAEQLKELNIGQILPV